jgi:hypothetical protein
VLSNWPVRIDEPSRAGGLGPFDFFVEVSASERGQGLSGRQHKSKQQLRESTRHESIVKNMHRLRALRLERDQKSERK